MLTKQWWCLIHSEKSLSFRVLKRRYFPRTTPMTVLKCSNGSYLWNNLLEGRKVVEKGAFWRVGNDQSIDAWRDPWLNKIPDYKAISPNRNSPTNLVVANLIDNESRKQDIVRDIFSTSDANLIMNTHLSKRGIPDKLIWRNSVTGSFLVKSAYYVAWQVLGREVFPVNQRQRVWRAI